MNRRTVFPNDAEWPRHLNELSPHDPPKSLKLEGLPLEVDFPRAVAIVGARYPTAAGVEAAQDMARGLAEAGFSIVSGLAVGIDAVAHRACLAAGGYTVAVLGTGLDVTYPQRNTALRQQVMERGTLVTEYADDMPPLAHNFPRRNRIIAGLSKAVIFVEGGQRSGGRITARIALEANRTVYAVPGSVRNPMAAGPNELIGRSEAALVTSFCDVLADMAPELAWESPETRRLAPSIEVAEDDRAIIFFLEETPVVPGKIRDELGLTNGKAALTLARLEARGWVTRRPGGYVLSRTGLRIRESIVGAGNG
jgi:DNA processing protein